MLFAILCCSALALPAGASAAFAPLSTYGATGTSGSAAGQLDNPGQVAIDNAGDLFVADVSNNRIAQFSASGAFVRAWGFGVDTGAAAFEVCTATSGCQAGLQGGEAGQLSSPFGIVLAGGNLFIAEEGGDRVSEFTTSGAFVRAFGFGVDTNAAVLEICTAASGCQSGNQSDAAGGFAFPSGITTDGAGNLYIAGGNNNRVDQFTTGGAFVRAFGYGVDTGAAGLEVCTATSTCQGGISGSAAGQFNGFRELAADGAGNLFVAHENSDRIDHFTTAGAFVRAWGFGVDTGLAFFEVCTTASGCEAGEAGSAAGQLDSPTGIAVDGGNVYVAEQSNNRASQFTTAGAFVRAWGFGVDTATSAFELCTAATTCQAGIDGTGAGQLSEPFAVGTDCRGAVYVVDDVNSNVQRFGEQGTPPPPCLQASVSTPSNEFSFGKLKLNKRKGIATLTVDVPGPGAVVLSGNGLVKQRPAAEAIASKAVGAAGKMKLLVKPKGKKKRKLSETGKVKVKAKVTYTPIGGAPNTESKRIKLKKDL